MSLTLHPDVKAKVESTKNAMNDLVKDHFFNPRNLVRDENELDLEVYNGIGMVGSAGCGDSEKIWLRIENNKIQDCKWFTAGCGSAISSSSILSTMLVENDGMNVDDAMKLGTDEILNKLGDVSSKKVHCSILCIKTLRAAINDYFKRTKKYDKIVIEGARIIDPVTKTTDKEIEEAVLNGILNLDEIKIKLNLSDKINILEIEELIRFYKDKYQYGLQR